MNILFLSSCDWNIIKQRPHFIAECLDAIPGYSVSFVHYKIFGRHLLLHNQSTLKIKPRSIPRLPFVRFGLIRFINNIIGRNFLASYISKNDIVFVTNPFFYPYIKKQKKQLIYDCLDDMLEFPQTKQQTEELFVYERELIRMANFVIFSAKYLQKVVQKRIDFDFHSIVLNNAIHIPKYSAHHDKTNVSQIIDELIKNGKRNIVYIGAISEWFDYDVIKKTAEKNPAVVFHLFGPVDVDFPPVKNIIFWGKLKHDDIFPVMEVSDALIMPFKLNKLILSVNPIKLYEYIYSGKAVIAIRYDETRYFEDFVYLYEAGDENSLLEMVTLLEKNGYAAKKSIAECREFAEANTWEKRILELKTYIDSALYI